MNPRHLNVSHPPAQRAMDDVLVKVTQRDGPTWVMYLSHGRAAFALARYPKGGGKDFTVERVSIGGGS